MLDHHKETRGIIERSLLADTKPRGYTIGINQYITTNNTEAFPMDNPFTKIDDKIEALIAKGIRRVEIRLRRTMSRANIEDLKMLDPDRANAYENMLDALEGD